MIIQEITLENFRQYKGKTTIKFSTSPEKNVTVIIGDNTSGKTTLVQSFIWCLYSHADFKDKQLLNAEALEELRSKVEGSVKDCSVTVSLNHNSVNYIIKRTEKYRVNKSGKIETEQKFQIYDDKEKENNFLPEELDNERDIIATILPENLSDYFFFWGERIEKLTERKELTQAVKQFLGLDTIELAKKHLNRVIRTLNATSLSESADSKIEEYTSKINQLLINKSRLKRDIQDLEINIQYYTEKKDEYFKLLTTSDNVELKNKQEEYKRKLDTLNSLENEFNKDVEKFNKKFNDSHNYVYVLGTNLEKKAVDILKKSPAPVEGWKYIDVNAINEILKRGKCICGTDICEHTKPFEYLIEQKKIVAPNMIGGAISSFIEQSERRKGMNDEYIDSFNGLLSKIHQLGDCDLPELEEEVNRLKGALLNVESLNDINQKYEDVLEKISDYERKLGAKNSEYNTNENKIKSAENSKNTLMQKNKKYEKQLREIQLAKDVLESFTDDYEEDEKKLKESLEKHVNEYFEDAYSGDRIIEIDDKYNAIPKNMVNGKWIQSETSPGLETVKNFSFIAGLVQCARDQIVKSEDYDNNIENKYPLVLDAPFSQADDKHIRAIGRLLSNNADQIILVVMEKDWNYAKKILSDNVGKKYLLQKVTETCSKVVEE